MIRLEMKKLQYDINRQVAEVSAYHHYHVEKLIKITGEEILLFNKRQIIQQANFAYFLLEKAVEKETEK